MHSRQLLARLMATLVAALMLATSLLATASPALGAQLYGSGGDGISATTAAGTAATFSEPFHWLQPLGQESGDPTKFDASLLNGLTVSICRVEASACTPVKTLTSASALSERLRTGQTSGKDSYYLANWDVSKLKLEPFTFRITVTIARLTIGTLDVGPSTYKSFGRTWPIKFRVERNPTIRTRVLNEAGKGASQIAAALRAEFGICGDDVATLLANDLDPFTQKEIDLAIAGACQDAEIWPWTKIADQATNDALTAFDPTTGQMTFARSTPVLANLKANDVLVGEPAAAAVAGYLRKITSITKNKKTGVITLETTQALLNEAVKDGELDAAADLKPADLVSSDLLPGVTLTTAKPAPQRGPSAGGGYALLDVGDGLDFHETVDVELRGSGSVGGVDGTGTVRIRGRIDFNAGWNIGAGIEACFKITLACVDRFEAWVGADLYSDIRVDGTFDGNLLREETLSTNFFSPIVFFIGPIPVVIVPIVKAIVGIDGTAHVEFSFDAQIQSAFKAGEKWTDPDDGGIGWEPIRTTPDPYVNGDANGDLLATMQLRAYAKADAKLLLYGVAGPGIAAQLGMEARVQYPGNPLWEIYGYIKGEINFAVDLGGMLTLGEKRDTVLDEDIRLKAADNQPPVCGWRTEPIPAEPGEELVLGPSDGYQGFFDCSDPEGDLPLYSAVDDLGAKVLLDQAKWTVAGLRTVTVTARDLDGKTTSFDLKVAVNESTPLVEFISATTSVQAGVQYWVTVSAFQPTFARKTLVGNYRPCRSLTWDVPGATTVWHANSDVTCTAMIVFAAPGPHTITVTATGAYGKQGQGTFDVNVTAPPSNLAPTIELGSFEINSVSGPDFGCDPLETDCNDRDACAGGFDCPVWMDSYLWNGVIGSFHGPLTLKLNATDRFGNSLVPTWHCVSGGFAYPVTDNGDGSFSCDPRGSANSNQILVRADITDGTTTVHSEVRRLWVWSTSNLH